MEKQFNLTKEIWNEKLILKENDFQTGEIEFSMTGELIPLERLEEILWEFVQELKHGCYEAYLRATCFKDVEDVIFKLAGKKFAQ